MGKIGSTLEAIDEAIAKNNPPSLGRTYLGASQLGEECERKLYYGFRWANFIAFSARILRLFDRGHREEPALNTYLRQAGIQVFDEDEETGEQFAVRFGWGHGGGHLDSVLRNLPELPDEAVLGEYKTSAKAQHKSLVKNGVEIDKPVHYAQMQLYMHLAKLDHAAYISVNKDNDEIHFELIDYNQNASEQLLKKADRIISSDVPPPRISSDPTFYKCKWCDYQSICHFEETPHANCRTCSFSTAEQDEDGDGRWTCAYLDRDINSQEQRKGCEHHLFIPHLLENWAKPLDGDREHIDYENLKTGKHFINGVGGYSSKEISACTSVELLGDGNVDLLRKEFNGRIGG